MLSFFQTAATTNNSGCWRWPNPDGAELWIHNIVHSVTDLSCCVPSSGEFSSCCEDNFPQFCKCSDVVDIKTFNHCSE